MDSDKLANFIVLDASPLLTNEPSISTLLGKSERLFTVPSVIAEIKDQNARSRLDTISSTFLTIRDPNPGSVKFVTDFARKTGDLQVLSRTDLQLLALAYELECERNHGDWRLRRVPGQKGLNGSPPPKVQSEDEHQNSTQASISPDLSSTEEPPTQDLLTNEAMLSGPIEKPSPNIPNMDSVDAVSTNLASLQVLQLDNVKNDNLEPSKSHVPDSVKADDDISVSDSSDSEGWITPSNLRRQQVKNQNAGTAPSKKIVKTMQVATITGDFAVQNVILQLNLNLLSSSMLRITNLRTYILRCHACFATTRIMSKQFCERCKRTGHSPLCDIILTNTSQAVNLL